MTHQQAVARLDTINDTLDELEGNNSLRNTRSISKMLLIDEKLSRLLHSNVNTALDERDSLEIEF
jgi:hypothetical protein